MEECREQLNANRAPQAHMLQTHHPAHSLATELVETIGCVHHQHDMHGLQFPRRSMGHHRRWPPPRSVAASAKPAASVGSTVGGHGVDSSLNAGREASTEVEVALRLRRSMLSLVAATTTRSDTDVWCHWSSSMARHGTTALTMSAVRNWFECTASPTTTVTMRMAKTTSK